MIKKIRVIKKILVIILLFYTVISIVNNVKAISLTEMEDQATNFINKGQTEASNIDMSNAVKDFASLGSILTMIGAGVMVAVTTYMGIKYLTSGPEAQAKLKVQLIGVVVSGMVIFGAYYIWKIAINISNQF